MVENEDYCEVNLEHHFLNRTSVINVINSIDSLGLTKHYDFEKHAFYYEKEGEQFQFRLPITLGVKNDLIDEAHIVKYLMLLVQTGSSAIGVFEGDKCLEHKVLSAYMVRKKQGKSQIKHLKTKGKSRAGSRVRLAKTLEFFENINERITRHIEENEFDRIAFSCSKILMPYLFGSKIPTPFEKKDPIIYRIPKHLHQPNFEVMLGMQRFLNMGELIFDEKVFPEVKDTVGEGLL